MFAVPDPTLAGICIMGISFIGALFATRTTGRELPSLRYFETISGGILLLVSFFLANAAVQAGGWMQGIAVVIAGALIMEIVHYLLPKHGTRPDASDDARTRADAQQMMVRDAIHNIGDGIFLVGAFAVNWYIGAITTIGILLSSIGQEISEYLVFREVGHSSTGSLVRNVAVSAIILIAVILSFALSSMPSALALLSGLAAGGVLSVILHDLLPQVIDSVGTSGFFGNVTGMLLGIIGVAAVQSFVPPQPVVLEVHSDVHIDTVQIHETPMVHAVTQPPTRTNPAPSNTAGGLAQPVATSTEQATSTSADEVTPSGGIAPLQASPQEGQSTR